MMTTTGQEQSAVAKGDQGLIQLVGFTLSNEEYGIDILNVQEINRMMDITGIPNVPDFVEGIINLRGKVIPIINLRRKFGFADKEPDKQTRIIVVNIDQMTLGLVVDAVSEVLRIPAGSIQPAPSIVSGRNTEYIRGIAKLNERLLILIDLTKIFSREITEHLGKVAQS